MSTLPILEEKKNMFITPGVNQVASIMDDTLVIQKPFAVSGCVYEDVKAYSTTHNSITFQKHITPTDLIDKGIKVVIPSLTGKVDAELALFKDRGSSPITAVGDVTDAHCPSIVPSFHENKVAVRPFYNMIQSVTIDGGDGFSFNITNVDLIMRMFPYYSDENNHKKHLAPECHQNVIELIGSRYVTTSSDGNSNGYDKFKTAYSTNDCYNPYSQNSPNGEVTTENVSGNTIKAGIENWGTVSVVNDAATPQPLNYARFIKKHTVAFTIRDIVFSLPHDLFRDLSKDDEFSLYGLTTLQINIQLHPWATNRLIYTFNDLRDGYMTCKDFLVATAPTGNYTVGIKYSKVTDVKMETPSLSFTRRKPISAVSNAMREQGDFKLPFNHIIVNKSSITGSYSRGSPKIQSTSTGDISLTTVPQYILFALAKRNHSNSEMATFAKINAVNISVDGINTTLRLRDLYNTSEKNGYFSNFKTFAHGAGSVCCVSMNDLNTSRDDLMVGANQNVNIIVNVTEATRIDSGADYDDGDSNEYELIVLSVLNHFLVKEGPGFSSMKGLTHGKPGSFSFDKLANISRSIVYAGGFWGSLWKGIKSIPQVLGVAADTAGRLSNAVNSGTAAFGSGINKNGSHVSGGAYADSDLFMR